MLGIANCHRWDDKGSRNLTIYRRFASRGELWFLTPECDSPDDMANEVLHLTERRDSPKVSVNRPPSRVTVFSLPVLERFDNVVSAY
jgi:hypothetical protein